MAQANTGYVRAAGAGAWTEVAYGADATTFINALVAALPATGGEIIIGPSTAGYIFTGAVASISKPVLVMCAPGATFRCADVGGEAVTTCLRVTSGGAGSIWTGGTFEDISTYAITGGRTLIDVQDGAHDVRLRDIAFSIANSVASGQSCSMVEVAGSSASANIVGFQMSGCRIRCNSTREATSSVAGVPLGWTFARLVNAQHAKITDNTFWGGATPQISTGNIRCILAMVDSEFCLFARNTGRGLLGLSNEQLSGSDVIDAGASGLIEITNVSQEGHHSMFEGNNFEVCTAYSFIREVGGSYGSIKNNHFGRMSMTDAVVRLADGGNGLGDGTAITGNTWHNISGPTQIRNCGYAVRVSGQKNVFIDASQFTLCNKQNAFERVPIRVDNGCRDVVIGSTQMGFNTTATNQFAPFTYIIWEGTDAYANTKLLFPTNFSRTPFVVR